MTQKNVAVYIPNIYIQSTHRAGSRSLLPRATSAPPVGHGQHCCCSAIGCGNLSIKRARLNRTAICGVSVFFFIFFLLSWFLNRCCCFVAQPTCFTACFFAVLTDHNTERASTAGSGIRPCALAQWWRALSSLYPSSTENCGGKHSGKKGGKSVRMLSLSSHLSHLPHPISPSAVTLITGDTMPNDSWPCLMYSAGMV